MAWKYKPNSTSTRVACAHWFEANAPWSLCVKVVQNDEWIDDVAGARLECRTCEKLIMRMENE